MRKGYYYRTSDSKLIARFRCGDCRRSFSTATFSPCYRQKKRKLNSVIHELLCTSVNKRGVARLLHIARKTVDRKLLFLQKQSVARHEAFLGSIAVSGYKFEALQFDEMETFERSKCLPISIPLVVCAKSRKILAIGVASMPAKGPLAQISVQKYGLRVDHRPKVATELLRKIAPLLGSETVLTSDENPKYPSWIRASLPGTKHVTIKGSRGSLVGGGELKKIGFDPIFTLNHTAAMIRGRVSRLVRRTWSTTKRIDRLEAHLNLYLDYHNNVLTPPFMLA